MHGVLKSVSNQKVNGMMGRVVAKGSDSMKREEQMVAIHTQ